MEWVVNATLLPLCPREGEPVLIVRETGWAPGPFWTDADNLASTGFRSRDRPAQIDQSVKFCVPELGYLSSRCFSVGWYV